MTLRWAFFIVLLFVVSEAAEREEEPQAQFQPSSGDDNEASREDSEEHASVSESERAEARDSVRTATSDGEQSETQDTSYEQSEAEDGRHPEELDSVDKTNEEDGQGRSWEEAGEGSAESDGLADDEDVMTETKNVNEGLDREGVREEENELDNAVFEAGLSGQQLKLNVEQATEGNSPVEEEKSTQESVLENEQHSEEEPTIGDEPPSDFTPPVESLDSQNAEAEIEQTVAARYQKWTKEELEEGDRLCAEALKLVDSKAESRKVFDLFKQASELGNTTAIGKVAFAQLFGSYTPHNFTGALEKFTALAEDGIPLGQTGLGFMYATGLGVNSSQAKALVYYQFAALGGDEYAQMIMGYRYWAGVTLVHSCESGLTYYRKAAATVAEKLTPHGGPIMQRSRLMDETEPSGQAQLVDEDLLQYYAFLADKGDMQAAVALGQLYYQGGRGIEQNFERSLHFFSLAAREGQHPTAYAFLGKLYYEENSELERDDEKALTYFRKAARESNPVGLYGLGRMYLDGRGVRKDVNQAFEYFRQSAESGWPEAQLQLGILYYTGIGGKKDYRKAIKQFSLATQSGNLLAFYNLAQMHAAGAGTMRACHTAVELFKNVAERGAWAKLLMDANDFYKSGDTDVALIMYMLLAEMGFEMAQSNAAYILDKGESVIIDKNEVLPRALLHWDRAAGQGYTTARLKLGDYYYYGHGTDVDYETAALHYRLASEQQHSSQAMFNLGYMHEHGLGMKKDFHLAKRFYDMAAESSIDAQAPTSLALANLGMKFWLDVCSEYLEMVHKLGLDSLLGKDWDLYLMAFVAGLLGLLVLIYRARQQQELERSQRRQRQQELELQRQREEQQQAEEQQAEEQRAEEQAQQQQFPETSNQTGEEAELQDQQQ